MAKKRGGGSGSNLVLILTLVFFILATVILGVTTYMGYSEVDKAVGEKEKEKKRAAQMQNEADWYRFQARVCREYMGHSMLTKEEDRQSLAREKGQFKANTLPYANNAPGLAEFTAFLAKIEPQMPWNAPNELAPKDTYESRLQEKDKKYDALAKTRDQLAADRTAAEDKVKKLEADLTEAKATFKKAVEDISNKAKEDLAAGQKELDTLRAALKEENEKKNREITLRAEADKSRDKFKADLTAESAKRVAAERDKKELREDRDRLRDENRTLAEHAQIDRAAVEARVMDSNSLEKLKNWRKDWHIVALDQKGTMPYINLGSADGLKPQTTFSIHSVGINGKLNLTPKGTLEVVRVIGPHLSRARVTSTRDAKADPILKGDKLFNPTWSPNERKRVAIAGLVDLGGEGIDSSEDFRRLLARQNVIVDAFIDTKGKLPEIKGEVGSNTDYLVLADTLEGVKHDKVRDKEFRDRFDKLVRDMRARAQANGVTIISLRRYLDMIGYQPPRVIGNRDRSR